MPLTVFRGAAKLRVPSTARAFSTSPCLLRARGTGYLPPNSSHLPLIIQSLGVMPTFHDPSSPELAQAYENVRENILIPSFLFKQHRNFVYRERNHKLLTDPENPVIVNIGSQDVQLTPRPTWNPPPINTFSHTINMMKTDKDFANIPALCYSYALGEMPLRESQIEKVARIMTLRGKMNILLKLAHQSYKHEHSIKFTKPLVREYMRGFLLQNQIPKMESMAKLSLKGIAHFLRLVCDPKVKRDRAEKLRNDPVVVGLELHAYASATKNYNNGEDYKHLTSQAAQRFLTVWEKQPVPELRETVKNDVAGRNRVKQMVLDFRPVMEGLVIAREILKGSETIAALKKHEKKLRETLEVWEAFLARQNMPMGRTWQTYKDNAVAMGEEIREKMGDKEGEGKEESELLAEDESEVKLEENEGGENAGEVRP
ncbi:hypothetical protein EX30DRAFT_394272 [Ascodesmis nigricans]|uniref:Uncharacterized protein n=1 Tax=Ascodesmis nigricans TaxID=341454 RepID=A0A4S2N212_9PEZI|nr:hypothetical protein EX30DRAFT_394272 [Ascodesmis nigricans]